MLDTYNQQIHNSVSCTIRTNINTANHHFIVMEEPKIIEVGKLKEGKHQQDAVQHENGLCRCICTGHHASTPHLLKTLVSESKIIQMGYVNDGKQARKDYESGNLSISRHDMTTMETRTDGVSNTLTSVQKDNYLCTPEATKNCQQGVVTNYRIRKLTPRECFRLMGVDDVDIDKIQAAGISNSQQYKMAGNSIVVDNLYHIFRTMFVDKPTKQVKQLTLF